MAFGAKAGREMAASLATLRRFHSWGVVQIGEHDAPTGLTDAQKSRWAKTHLLDLTPFGQTLYIDADTRVHGDISAGFRVLDDGWDVAMAPSENQGQEWLWHVSEGERNATRAEWGMEPLQLQAGLMFVARNRRTYELFAEWQRQWARWRDQDQGALLRALRMKPVRLWLLGRPWNGRAGALVEHLFGRTR
ncbi:MAG TPA: hypothetical protein VM537_15885 [Anaerolineae bacterium]|nr:hypothetical protein [Anaerolineae bacterium]